MHDLRYREFLKPAGFIGGGILLLCVSGFLLYQSGILSPTKVEVIDAKAQKPTPQASSEAQLSAIMVEVAGEVLKPGVYSLPPGSRVQDALTAAGALLPSADYDYIQKSINKAAKLTDSQKIYIPKKGEIVKSELPPLVLGSSQAVGNPHQMSINLASQSELEALQGVGPATAKKIIAGRPYTSIEELKTKKVLSQKVFDQVKEEIGL